MFGQLLAFLAVASVAFSSNCGRCYPGYGAYVNAEPGVVAGIGRGCYRSRVLTAGWESPCELRATPIELPATPIMASRSCSSQIVSSPVVSSPIVSSPIVSSPIVSSPIVSSPIVSSPVVSSPIVSSPIVSSGIVSAPVEVRESPVLAVRPCGLVRDICDSRAYATPLFRESVGFPEVVSSCENSARPVVVSSGLPVIRPQASVISC